MEKLLFPAWGPGGEELEGVFMGRREVARTSGPILFLGKTEYVSSAAGCWVWKDVECFCTGAGTCQLGFCPVEVWDAGPAH